MKVRSFWGCRECDRLFYRSAIAFDLRECDRFDDERLRSDRLFYGSAIACLSGDCAIAFLQRDRRW
ncbi:MAG: hypothetical protein ACR9NN_01310 [Nostochopsis sp.]